MPSFESVATPWLLLSIVAAASVVVWSGSRLTRYGDALAEMLGLSRTWIGVILLAFMTSLPEVIVALSAQLTVVRPGLVISNVCGSNLFNLLIFALIDIYAGAYSLSCQLGRGLLKPAWMGLAIMGITATGFLFPLAGAGEMTYLYGWPVSAAIFAFYIYAVRNTKVGGSSGGQNEEPSGSSSGQSSRNLLIRFAGLGLLIVGSGTALVLACDAIIGRPLHLGGYSFSLGESVVGIIGVAIVTSLPELVVCMSAIRLGSFEMALGNIFGSNIFNMALLPLAHVVCPRSSFWSATEPIHLFSLLMSIVLTCVIMVGITKKSKWTVCRLGWDGALVAVLGITAFVLVAVFGTSV